MKTSSCGHLYLLQSWNTVSGRPSTSDLLWTSSHTHGFSDPVNTSQNICQVRESEWSCSTAPPAGELLKQHSAAAQDSHTDGFITLITNLKSSWQAVFGHWPVMLAGLTWTAETGINQRNLKGSRSAERELVCTTENTQSQIKIQN